ncbi:Aste57867_8374 [Aphanomyces stellatus]|uniref:Transmembrane protein 198 n=1 Tax=Aphanomyces stellatus TaxID=120398 RepID=A0A485KK57_9STRA|nr:hypothetical protein As57867_008342 [Aphanomyces stellatus]VFT85260.1 Aste57867_8374 [Aphanomyces stellatus]
MPLLSPSTVETVKYVGSVAVLIANVFTTFLGYKHFHAALVFQATVLGGFVGWCIGNPYNDSSTVLNLLLALGLGFFVAIFTCWMKRSMKFLLGAVLGVQIGTVLNVLFLHDIKSPVNKSNPNSIGYIVMSVLAVVLGAYSVCAGRPGHIVLAAWGGAFWVALSMGNLIGNLPPLFYPYSNASLQEGIPTLYLLYVFLWIALGIVGTVVQNHLALHDHNVHPSLNAVDEEISKVIPLGPQQTHVQLVDNDVYVQETS